MISIRRLFIAILAIVAVSVSSDAQLRYGFRFGGSFAKASVEHVSGAEPVNRSGFSGGLMLEYQVPTCGLATDIAVAYTRYNARLRLAADASGIVDAGRNFVEIPLHVKYKFWLPMFSRTLGPMIYTGPSAMIKCGGNDNTAFATRRVQAGWDAGIGFDIVNFIQITGGYRWGLGNSALKSADYPDISWHTNGWNVAVNMIFDF